MLATVATGVTAGIVLDVGARGEGSEISVVYDNQVFQRANMRIPGIDEGCLDDWLALQLLVEDPSLPETLSPSSLLSSDELVLALRKIIASLKELGGIAFYSKFFKTSSAFVGGTDDAGEFDVVKQLEAKGNKKGKAKKTEAELDAMDFEVPHPLFADADGIMIGSARHKYLEPLYVPELLRQLKPVASLEAGLLNFTEYEEKEIVYAGVQEMIAIIMERVDGVEMRKAVWDSLVIISSGKVGGIKGTSFSFFRTCSSVPG
jgi:actin-related protein 9